ncbi:hypothetical protein PV356_35285 [Streptomyces sp. WI03-5b]|nr:hypothetical protein [Streptomyces sp. WI03-5b]MDX2624685.1 hypothetical protein [Streptomyces sp. WI03-5b]
MSTEEWLLLAVLALGLVDLAAIVTAWLADRHLTHTAHRSKE